MSTQIVKASRTGWSLVRKSLVGPEEKGFAGPGHTAVEVFGSGSLADTDPFVMLMDDRLAFSNGQEVGQAHPHSGLETVTLILEGSLEDSVEGLLEAGDVAWMTAGRGVIHNEKVRATGYARILQLWIALPRSRRQIPPALQLIPGYLSPVRREPGVHARLYSGVSGELKSPTLNNVPVIMLDMALDGGASLSQEIPGRWRVVLYVITGSLKVAGQSVQAGEVGWFGASREELTTMLISAAPNGARALLYAGAPVGEPLVHRGPFVAGSEQEIGLAYQSFLNGEFELLGSVHAPDSGGSTVPTGE